MTPIAGVRMWRAWRIIIPVVVANAIVQVALVILPVPYDAPFVAPVMTILSGVVALSALVIVASAAHFVVETRVTWAQVRASLQHNFLRSLLWAATLATLIFLGVSFWVLPGVIVAAVTPFVLVAAATGDRHPLRSNFRVIGHKFWRWAVTTVLISIMLVVGSLVAGFTEFFLRELLGASIVWLVLGVFASWVITAFTLIYRASVGVTHSAAQ